MPAERDKPDCQKFHHEAIAGQEYGLASTAEMNPPHQPDQNDRDARNYQVQQPGSLSAAIP